MLTGVDYAIIAVILLSAIRGAWRGLIAEVFSLIGWVAALTLGARYSWVVSRYVPPDWPGGALTQWAVGFAAVVIAVMFASAALGAILGRLTEAFWLRSADSSLGLAFGALRGALIVLILLIAASYTELPRHEAWRESRLKPYASDALRVLKPHLPAALAGLVKDDVLSSS